MAEKRYYVTIEDLDGATEESFATAGEAVAWIVEENRHRRPPHTYGWYTGPKILYGEVVTPEELNEIALKEAKEKP